MPDWLDYEKTVYAFVKALDPSLAINHNVFTNDYDTGKPRQRDIIINASIAQIFPVTILISCKDKNRKLSEQDIDAFIGEMRSANVQKGVIFSKKGYSKNAIIKCRKLSISCCQVFTDSKIELPEELIFFSAYCIYPIIQLQIIKIRDKYNKIKTWNDFYDLVDVDSERKETVIDHIENLILKSNEKALTEAKGAILKPWQIDSEYVKNDEMYIHFKLIGCWRIYVAKSKFMLGRGIFEQANVKYVGSLSTPPIDTYSDNPGEGWEEITGETNLQKPLNANILFNYNYKYMMKKNKGTELIKKSVFEKTE